jgi:hypothetical protein
MEKTYKIKLKYIGSGQIEEMTVTTDDIVYTLEQLQRNRQPLTTEVKEI